MRALIKIKKVILSFILFIFSVPLILGADEYLKQRQNMVKDGIIARGISDERVLKAMFNVPRHLFVPEKYRDQAYQDHPLPIGEGQTISQPYIVALMSESLNLQPTDRVLEIGTGSGYQAAILGEMTAEVFTIEIVKPLVPRAQKVLASLGYKNIKVKSGDGYYGWPEFAPFDAIIITAAAKKIPEPLVKQLEEGGRMILPLEDEPFIQSLVLLHKKNGRLIRKELIPVLFVPMTGEIQKK